MFFSLMKFYNTLVPVNPVEIMGRSVDLLLKQNRRIIKNSSLPKEQKYFLETIVNFNAGTWYLGENTLKSYEEYVACAKKVFPNIMEKALTGKLEQEEIFELLDFLMKYGDELSKNNNKAFSKVANDYRKRFEKALEKNNKKAMLKLSRAMIDEQWWINEGIERLDENVRRVYGLGVSSEVIFKTTCMKLLRIDPVYNEGEKPGDFKYTKQPVLWLPPTVLDHDIIALLPNYGMSMVHSLAKHHPVYVMIFKDYKSKPVLKMTIEDLMDNILDILKFLNLAEGTKPILAGYCQGGTIALLASLTEKINPYIKAIFAAATPTGKHDTEDIKPMTMFFEDLELAGELVDNKHLMLAKEPLFIGLKKKGSSNGSEFLAKMLTAKKYRERIKELVKKGISVKDAFKQLSVEVIHESAQRIWVNSKKAVPWATSKLSSLAFANGISADGYYNIEIFKQKLNVHYLEETNKPAYFFPGLYDKVVPMKTATEFANHSKVSTVVPIPCGHIGLATEFKKNLHDPIIQAVEAVSKMTA